MFQSIDATSAPRLVFLFTLFLGLAFAEIGTVKTHPGLRRLVNNDGEEYENSGRPADGIDSTKIDSKIINDMFITDRDVDGGERSRDLIVNGENVDVFSIPKAMVFLSDRDDKLMCGGTLISHRIVLAAAHCQISLVTHAVFNRDHHPHYYQSQNPYEIRIPIETEINHPDFDYSTLNNDVQLLVLEESPLNYAGNPTDPYSWQPGFMKLHTPDMPTIDEINRLMHPNAAEDGDSSEDWLSARQNDGTPVTTPLELVAMGWGHEWDGEDSGPSARLKMVRLNYVTNEECRRQEISASETYWDKITSKMMCTWTEDHDTCHGDSGGPIMFENPNYWQEVSECPDCDIGRYLQVGIVSWGEDCADEVFPGVAARVAQSYSRIRDRVCSIDGAALAPSWFECAGNEETYSPVPTVSPTSLRSFAPAERPPTTEIAVEIFLDVFAEETAWELIAESTGETVFRNDFGDYTFENKIRKVFDLENGAAYEFAIADRFGDGITVQGGYRIFVVDETKFQKVGEILAEGSGRFGSYDTQRFVVPIPPPLPIETTIPIDAVAERREALLLDEIRNREERKRNRIGQLRGEEGIVP